MGSAWFATRTRQDDDGGRRPGRDRGVRPLLPAARARRDRDDPRVDHRARSTWRRSPTSRSPTRSPRRRIRDTVVIKLNGGLGTSMGMDRAKSLLCVRRGLSFLDIIARQVLHVREKYDAPLPLLFMNSFRTCDDTMAALARYDDLPVEGLPLDFLQNKEPKLLAKDLTPVSYPKDPDLEWCPPGHGDVYTALRGTGLLDTLIEPGYRHVLRLQLRQPRRDARPAGGRLVRRAPARRSRSRRSGVPRRTARAATSPAARATAGSCCARPRRPPTEDLEALADLDRHRSARPTTCGSTWSRCGDTLDPRRRARPAADPQRQDRRPRRPVDARR